VAGKVVKGLAVTAIAGLLVWWYWWMINEFIQWHTNFGGYKWPTQ